MSTDARLLQFYVERGSEPAFTTLVERHLPVVYSAALRQVGGDPHRAQEVVQTVFSLKLPERDCTAIRLRFFDNRSPSP